MAKLPSISSILETIRYKEWWVYKIVIILGTCFATSHLLKIPFNQLIPFLLFLLVSLIPGAIYVSLINDLTDLEDDLKAGKENRLIGKSQNIYFVSIAICLLFGIIICFYLPKLALLLYSLAWISYTLYSVPPLRLKRHGFFGVLADALGANFFPQLYTVAIVTHWFNKELDIYWFSLIGIWSLFWGLRGILWHQLKDKANDQVSEIKTFVQKHNFEFVKNLGVKVFFPIEFASIIVILVYSRGYAAIIFLLVYFFLEWLRYSLLSAKIILLVPTNEYRIFMLEYYSIFFPFAYIISGLNFSILSWLILICFIAFFFQSLKELIQESGKLLKEFLLGY